MNKKHTVRFGPFGDIDPELIKFAGWVCSRCGKSVRKLGLAVPVVVPRLMLYNCHCISVAVWEDERQPTLLLWPANIEMARLSDAEVLIFSGNKPTPAPGFGGVN